MKTTNVFTAFLIIALLSILPLELKAIESNSKITTTVTKQPSSNNGLKIEVDPEGKRVPGRRIACTIDFESGVDIAGIEKNEIISYEIVEEGNVLCVSTNEIDFVEALFSFTGVIQIRFITNEYILTGYIHL